MNTLQRVLFLLLISAAVILPQQVTGLKGWTIAVDAGHSRDENMGVSGYSEARHNLQVALALRDLLLQNTDISTVYLTRTNDTEVVGLADRTTYANSVGASWFHSIHSDAPSTSANSTLLLWGQYNDGREKIPNGGKIMSGYITDLLTRGMRTTTRGSWGDCSFYGCTTAGPYLSVNRNSVMPSQLSEAGFHTNPEQNQRQMNEEWDRLEAYTLYWSVLKLHGIPRPPVSILAGFITDLERRVKLNGATISTAGKSYTTDSYENRFHKYSSKPDEMRNGFYFLEDISEDSVEVIVSHPEYRPDTLMVALNDTFFTFKDIPLIWNRPPYVVSTIPVEGAPRVLRTSLFTLNFSRPMNKTSLEASVEIVPSAGLIFSWTNNFTKMVIKTDTLQVETDYTLRISAAAVDQYGHSFDGNGDGIGGDDFLYHFRTGPIDMAPPKIAATFPLNASQVNELQPVINVLYDEEIDSASVRPEIVSLENAAGQPVPGILAHYVLREKSLLSFFPGAVLAPNQYYTFKIQPGLRDKNENEESGLKTLRFRSGLQNWNLYSIDDFENGMNNWWAPAASGTTTGTLADSTSLSSSTAIINHLTSGALSMRINYGWDTGKTEWILREYLNGGSPKNVRFDNTKILQVYVFGDGSGTQFRFAVDDRVPNYVAANHEVSPWYTIDWYGWRLVSWNMQSDGTGTWLGDGTLDGALGFDSIQLGYRPGGATSGAIYFDDLRVAEIAVVPVLEGGAEAAHRFSLGQNYPNPFNPATTITYSVGPVRQQIGLIVYNLLGHQVRQLIDEAKSAGEYRVVWDGRDDAGRQVSSGIYLYRLTMGEEQATKTMLFMK